MVVHSVVLKYFLLLLIASLLASVIFNIYEQYLHSVVGTAADAEPSQTNETKEADIRDLHSVVGTAADAEPSQTNETKEADIRSFWFQCSKELQVLAI